jgi:hypothetical protein
MTESAGASKTGRLRGIGLPRGNETALHRGVHDGNERVAALTAAIDPLPDPDLIRSRIDHRRKSHLLCGTKKPRLAGPTGVFCVPEGSARTPSRKIWEALPHDVLVEDGYKNFAAGIHEGAYSTIVSALVNSLEDA